MLTKEENERMCRVGPGTPMGDALRRYWIPALLSADLPEADCTPKRVQLLGENFVAFRDTNGEVGVLDEACPHRGASLALGRVEDCGIRCLYHGWKFGTDGTIQDTPNMPNPQYKDRFKAPAYPAFEAGGMVWVYLGPNDKEPPRPHFRHFDVDADHIITRAVVQPCNYVQIMEGFVDSSHLTILHQDALASVETGGFVSTESTSRIAADAGPRLEIANTDSGFCYAAIRAVPSEGDPVEHARVTTFTAPIFSMQAPDNVFIAAVPMDDESTLFFNVFWDIEKPINTEPLLTQTLEFFGLSPEIIDRMGMTFESWKRPDAANPNNHFLQDREGMEAGTTFSGLPDFVPEDAAITNSMGPFYDRTREHLVPADAAVIRMRRLLLHCADLVEKGGEPIGVRSDKSQLRAVAADLDPGQRWVDLIELQDQDAW
ncbi:Rieske 2Fe-2S domain-containing protein [Rhodococcus koreensis]